MTPNKNIEEQGLAATADWQDRVRVILDSWVKRMIAFGELKKPEKIGGFTIYECPDIIPFIEQALDQQRQSIIEELEGMEREYIPGEEMRIKGYNQCIQDAISKIKEL